MKFCAFCLITVNFALLFFNPPCFSQGVTVEPDTIDFRAVSIWANGRTETTQQFTITNNLNRDAFIRPGIATQSGSGIFEIMTAPEAEIRDVIREIEDGVWSYRQDNREDPSGLDDLLEAGYLTIDERILAEWEFDLVGQDPIAQIEAVSTDEMPEGGGRWVFLDVFGQRFYSYLSASSISIDAGESATFVLAFNPIDESSSLGHISLYGADIYGWMVAYGSGEFPKMLEPSADEVSFGAIPVGLRSRFILELENIGDFMFNVDLSFTDTTQFYCFHPDYMEIHNAMPDIADALKRFQADREEVPYAIEQLVSEGYLEIDTELLELWNFEWGYQVPIDEIHVNGSTPDWRFDLRFTYYLSTDRFQFRHSRREKILAPGRTTSFVVVYAPKEIGNSESTLLVSSSNPENSDQRQEYEVHLSGNGLGVSDPSPILPPTSFSISAFPSPFNSSAIVSFQSPFTGDVRASLVDGNGRELRKYWIPAYAGMMNQGSFRVDGSGLSAGTYWLRFEQNGRAATQRLSLVK